MQTSANPSITTRIENCHWPTVTETLHSQGFALLRQLLTFEECDTLKVAYHHSNLYRKTIIMERYRFGLGEYKYFNYPLPPILQSLRENMYSKLVPIANAWMNVLNIDTTFPQTHPELIVQCQAKLQTQPTVLILNYATGGFNTLHQDLYGEVYFPLQCVLFLTESERDYTGGEFVLTQQTPRAQSKAIVLQPKKGDMLVFTTNFRPVKGSKGYYRAAMKHGVSEIHSGERCTLGIIFHDAQI